MQTQGRYVNGDERVETPGLQEVTHAFGHILSSQLPMLYHGAYRLLGNEADAEDALQDALLAAYTHLDQFKGQSRMSTWMTTIVHNCARMQMRTRRRCVLRLLSNLEIGQLLEDEVWSNLNLLAPESTICLVAADRLRRPTKGELSR